MTYAELIKRFEPYADKQVSMVTCLGQVMFYPHDDGNNEIIVLEAGREEPFLAQEVEP